MKYIFYFIGILFLLPTSLQTMQRKIYTLIDSTLHSDEEILENKEKKPVIRIAANDIEKRIIQLTLCTQNADHFYNIIKNTIENTMESVRQVKVLPAERGFFYQYRATIPITASFDKNNKKDVALIYDINQNIHKPNSNLSLLLNEKAQYIEMFIHAELYEYHPSPYHEDFLIPRP